MQVVSSMSDTDARFNTQACRDAREAATRYDDHTVARAGLGIAAGLLLGPFGLIPAIIADSAQDARRRDLNNEIRNRCQSVPGAPEMPRASPAESTPVSATTP